ncbi:MAG TPA: four-carbon acid sugar kinase family protein [Bryobacteraceae bacterium]|nr:four-carbon acid sugar kinase family protein [Bryobacteraceae bacterium]
MILGAIADDSAGSLDLAGLLQANGVRTVLLFGDGEPPRGYDVAAVSAKSSALAPKIAAQRAVQALERLQAGNLRQVFFQFRPSFGEARRDNAGPVTDALLNALGEPFTVFVPLPKSPISDAALVRWLQRQTPSRVGLLRLPATADGLVTGADRLRRDGTEIALANVAVESDLDALAEAFASLPLLAGDRAWAAALPAVWKRRGWLTDSPSRPGARTGGPALLLAGHTPIAPAGWGEPPVFVDGQALLRDPEAETGRVLKSARRLVRQQGYAEVRIPAMEMAAEERDLLIGVTAATLAGEVRRFLIDGEGILEPAAAALGVEAAEVETCAAAGAHIVRPLRGASCTLVVRSAGMGERNFAQEALENT